MGHLDDLRPQGYCGVGASFGPPNYGDFDPRISFAWAPAKYGGTTVIRAGFGIYHEDGQLDDQNIPDKNEVLSYALTPKNCPGLSYPIVLNSQGNPVCSNGTQSPNAEQRNRKDSYVTQWGASIEHAMPGNFVGTMSYVGSKGTDLLQLSYVNVVNPLTGLRPYPAFSQISWRGNIGNSSYNALALSLKRNFSRGLLVSANYTWSHSIDDGSNGSGDGDSLSAQNVSCWPREAAQCGERASSAFDARHVFNANFIYELPFGAGKPYFSQNGFVRAVFSYWQISSIFIARTGFPVHLTTSGTGPDGNTNSQRPNLVPDQPLYLAGGTLTQRLFAPPGRKTRFTQVVLAPPDSEVSPAISCGVPGSGDLIGRFPDASPSQNRYRFSSGPRYSTLPTERSLLTRMASFRLLTSAGYICL